MCLLMRLQQYPRYKSILFRNRVFLKRFFLIAKKSQQSPPFSFGPSISSPFDMHLSLPLCSLVPSLAATKRLKRDLLLTCQCDAPAAIVLFFSTTRAPLSQYDAHTHTCTLSITETGQHREGRWWDEVKRTGAKDGRLLNVQK